MRAGDQTRNRMGGQRWSVPEGEQLERALVVGLMLEVVLEAPAPPVDPQIRRRHIKTKLTSALVTHLAGRITLDRFRLLLDRLEQWFPFYYPLMPHLPPAERQTGAAAGQQPSAGASGPSLVRRDLLREWLEDPGGGLLPRRPQGKVRPQGLDEFLQRTQGCWFRVKDLAQAFDIDRKTAWEYLQKLQAAGLLVHNGERSAAVRYRLAEPFLKVRLAALERQAAQVLAGLPWKLWQPTVEWLAATAGEPFWEESWPPQLGAGHREALLDALLTGAVLEVVCQSGRQRLLRLRRKWLQE